MKKVQRFVVLVSITALASAERAGAAVMPYSENFDSFSPGSSLPGETVGGSGATANSWSVIDSSGNHKYQNTLTGSSSTKGITSLQFPALGVANPANGFEMSAIVSPTSVSSPTTVNYTVGLRVFGTTGTSSDDSYVADLNIGLNGGRIRIVEFTGAAATIFPSSTQSLQPLIPNFSITKSYLMDLVGSYNGSNALTLAFTVTDINAPSDTVSYTLTTPDITPRTGQFFGVYDSSGSGGGTMVVNYDNLTITPEPTSYAVVSLAATALLLRRRRQSR
jgi:hypothetical protein